MKKALIFVALALIAQVAFSQSYLEDLWNGDVGKVEKKLKLLGLTFAAEPLIPLYLDGYGTDVEVLNQLVLKGANVNALSPKTGLSSLYVAIQMSGENSQLRDKTASIVRFLLEKGARFTVDRKFSETKSLIDYCFTTDQIEVAQVLSQANQKKAAKDRVPADSRSSLALSVLGDDLPAVRKILANNSLKAGYIWTLAIAGNATKTVELMTGLDQLEFLPISERLVGDRLSITKVILENGGVLGRNQFTDLLKAAYNSKNTIAFKEIAAHVDEMLDEQPYFQSLELGPDCFSALTKDGEVFTNPKIGYEGDTRTLLFLRRLLPSMFGVVPNETVNRILKTYFPSEIEFNTMKASNIELAKYIVENFPEQSTAFSVQEDFGGK